MHAAGGCATYTDDFEFGGEGWMIDVSHGPAFVPFVDGTGDTWFFADQVPNQRTETSITREFMLPPEPSASLSFELIQNVEESCPYDTTYVFVNGQTLYTNCDQNYDGKVTIGLGAFAGQPVNIRIEFDTGDSYGNSGDGVYIDDVTVTTCP